MVLTYSSMVDLGTSAPDFNLPDVVTNKRVSLKDFAGKKALLVMIICNHCPYVKHIKEGLSELGRDYQNKDIAIVGISSNDVDNYPDDSPAELKKMAEHLKLTFPILFDEDQSVAKAYTAACTPDFFLFDNDRKLVYRGQLDDSRPGNDKPVTGKDLRAAMDKVIAGQAIDAVQSPSTGCNIKWKPGTNPNY
ncbi:MAG TPA: thioredoxin family protein [Chroococcales cyanobacterium]